MVSPEGIETFNQQIKSLLLCQLSYGPTRELRGAEVCQPKLGLIATSEGWEFAPTGLPAEARTC